MTDRASFTAGAEAKCARLFTASLFCRRCWSRRLRYRRLLLPAFRLCAMHDWGIPRGQGMSPIDEFLVRRMMVDEERRK